MPAVTRSTIRGIAIHDPRLTTIWQAQSSYTQASPHAGIPDVTPSNSKLLLSAIGEQTPDTEIQIYSMEPGLALDGSYVWRKGTSGDWYGWEIPIGITGWEAWVWAHTGIAAGPRATYYPHAVTLRSGTVLCVVQVTWRTAMATTEYHVRVYRRDPTTGAIASARVYDIGSAPTDGVHPCLVVDPVSGRVYCLSWVELGATAQVRVDYSDDDGATWTRATSRALRTAIVTTDRALGRLRAAWGRGGVMLLAGVVLDDVGAIPRDLCYSFCSIDDCANFEQTGTLTASQEGAQWMDVVWVDDAYLVATIPADLWVPVFRRLPSADCPIDAWGQIVTTATTEIMATSGAGLTADDSDISLVLADDGTVYLLGRMVDIGANSACVVHASRDGGRTWIAISHGDEIEGEGAWWHAGDPLTHPRGLAGTWYRGQIICLHNWAAYPGDKDNSLGCAYLGGYSTLTLPGYLGDAGLWYDACSWTLTWLPFDLPGDCGWTQTGAGVEVLDDGEIQLNSTSGSIYYHQHPTSSMSQPMIAQAILRMISGGSVIIDDVILRLRLDDGTHWYQVAVYLSTTGLSLQDEIGLTDLGTDVMDLTDGVEIRVSLLAGYASCHYRIPTRDGERKWTLLGSAAVADGGAMGVGTNLILWGHRSGAAAESAWISVCCSSRGHAGETFRGQANPDGLQGRFHSALPTYISEGVSISASAGPTMRGDMATIRTAYGYPIDHILPTVRPSPRDGWRNNCAGVVETIALSFGPASESGPGGDILVLGVFATNLSEIQLQGSIGSPAVWSTIATYRSDSGLSGLHFTRTGNTIQSDGTALAAYVHVDELAGGSFVFDTGEIRRILHNTEGSLGSGTGKRATIILEGVHTTDPTSGTAGSVRVPWLVGWRKLSGANYSGWRLRIPAQDTVDGDYRIGTITLGWMHVLGSEPSWGRSVELQQCAVTTESGDWLRSTRIRAPARRIVEISLSDGVDTTGGYSGDPPCVLDAAGGVPVASLPDTPWAIEGYHRGLLGPGAVGVYIPALPYAGTNGTLNRRWQAMLCEVEGDLRIDTVQGEEGSTEIVRIPRITLREVV